MFAPLGEVSGNTIAKPYLDAKYCKKDFSDALLGVQVKPDKYIKTGIASALEGGTKTLTSILVLVESDSWDNLYNLPSNWAISAVVEKDMVNMKSIKLENQIAI